MRLLYGLAVTADPDSEPIEVGELKEHLRVDHDLEDAKIASLGKAARQWAEKELDCSIAVQTWEMSLDRFPNLYWPDFNPCTYAQEKEIIDLPRQPLLYDEDDEDSHPVTIQYVDTAGVLQTLATSDYQVDHRRRPARVAPAPAKYWPTTQEGRLRAVRVEYTAGFETLPADLKAGLLLLVGHWYIHPEAVNVGTLAELPLGVRSLLMPYWSGRY